MPADASTTLFVGFLVLVALLWLGAVLAVRRAGVGLDEAPRTTRRWTLGTGLVLGGWIAATGALGASGLLTFDSVPPPLFLVLGCAVVAIVVLVWSPFGTRLIEGLPLWILVGYQAFRIGVELMLHQAYTDGLIPVHLTYLGYNFDVLSGVSALVVALMLAKDKAPDWLVLGWNVAGLVLLITIVSMSILSAPLPFRMFHEGPAVVWINHTPWIWLPTMMVAAALFGHLLVFKALWRARTGPR